MKARWLSRGSLLSVALFSAVAVAACGRGQTTGDEAPERPAAAAQEETRTQRTPGYRLFRQIDAMDLTADQREELRVIESDLAEDLAPHRETMRQVVETLAKGLEAGTLDTREAARSEEALAAAVADARVVIATAMNDVHGVLDASQREELVLTLRARRWQPRGEDGSDPRAEEHREKLSKVSETLGLSEMQKQAIRERIQAQVDMMFPERKARRDAWDAKMKAFGDAFMSDDFQAEDFDLGSGAEEAIASFTNIARQAIDFSGGILSPSQRMIAASMLRSRAAEL